MWFPRLVNIWVSFVHYFMNETPVKIRNQLVKFFKRNNKKKARNLKERNFFGRKLLRFCVVFFSLPNLQKFIPANFFESCQLQKCMPAKSPKLVS